VSANCRGDRFTAIVTGRNRGAATPCSARRLPEHPAADRNDQSGFLGKRNELPATAAEIG
jgi:hypothetical protein